MFSLLTYLPYVFVTNSVFLCWYQSTKFEVKIVTFDLGDRPGIVEALRKARDCHGPVDIVINNGGISSRGCASDTSLDVDFTVMNINYFGQVAVTKG